MGTNKALRKAKHDAYMAKQEKQGRKVVNWIFGILIVLAIMFAIFKMFTLLFKPIKNLQVMIILMLIISMLMLMFLYLDLIKKHS